MRRFMQRVLYWLSDMLWYLRWQTDRLAVKLSPRPLKAITFEEYTAFIMGGQKQMKAALSREFFKDKHCTLGKVK